MNLFLINFKNDKNAIQNKKLQSEISKILSEKIAEIFYGKKLTLSHQKDGSPYFKNEENLNISISHSKGIIALLFDKIKTGVDIEYIKNRDFKNILKYFKIDTEDISKEEFYQIWTDFETRYKAKGDNTKSFIYKDYVCSYCINETLPDIYETEFSDDFDNLSFKKIRVEYLPESKIKIK